MTKLGMIKIMLGWQEFLRFGNLLKKIRKNIKKKSRKHLGGKTFIKFILVNYESFNRIR